MKSATATTYLSPLVLGIVVGETDGKETFVSSSVFGIVFNENLLGGGCKSAPAIYVVVDELTRSGEFSDFLGNTATELEKRRLHRGHLIKFCEAHPKKLCENGYATFAVVTKGDEPVKEDLSNVFVAGVSFGDGGRLGVGVFGFSDGRVWGAEGWHRVVSPQQQLCCCFTSKL